ncbi:MAG: class I SAM-dependent methyltransferase [Planctomycetota bacterium]|jgi:SAM-dependent methyltransferase
MLEKYGTPEWLEDIFKSNDNDPWGHNFRGVELYRYDLIIRMIEKHVFRKSTINNEFRVLDIGCALGHFTRHLYELNNNLLAIDISKTAIDRARAKFDYIDFRVGSLPDSSLQGSEFGLITCLEVLYYMDEHEQRTFLCAMDSLLKENGTGVITSVIGEKPYFESADLVMLLSEYFEIKYIEYYGSKWYGRFDGLLFDMYKQTDKIQRFLTFNREELRQKFASLTHPNKRLAEAVMVFIIRFNNLKILTFVLLKLMKKLIRTYLSWKVPAIIFHFISRRFSFKPTHIFVLVAKHR